MGDGQALLASQHELSFVCDFFFFYFTFSLFLFLPFLCRLFPRVMMSGKSKIVLKGGIKHGPGVFSPH